MTTTDFNVPYSHIFGRYRNIITLIYPLHLPSPSHSTCPTEHVSNSGTSEETGEEGKKKRTMESE
jgi:hypothetical protein